MISDQGSVISDQGAGQGLIVLVLSERSERSSSSAVEIGNPKVARAVPARVPKLLVAVLGTARPTFGAWSARTTLYRRASCIVDFLLSRGRWQVSGGRCQVSGVRCRVAVICNQ